MRRRDANEDGWGGWDLRFALTLPKADLVAPAKLDSPRGSDDLIDFFFGVARAEGKPALSRFEIRAIAPDTGVEQPSAIVGAGFGTGVQCFGLQTSRTGRPEVGRER